MPDRLASRGCTTAQHSSTRLQGSPAHHWKSDESCRYQYSTRLRQGASIYAATEGKFPRSTELDRLVTASVRLGTATSRTRLPADRSGPGACRSRLLDPAPR